MSHSLAIRPSYQRVLITLFCLSALAACSGDADDASTEPDTTASTPEDTLERNAGSADAEEPVSAPTAAMSGLATFVVGGTTYEITSENCVGELGSGIADTNDFGLIGTGQHDGEELFGKVVRLRSDLDGDGEDDVLHTFQLEFGTAEDRQASPDKPSLVLQLAEGVVEAGVGVYGVEYEVGRLSGRGGLIDRNRVLAEANEPIPFTFVATCVPAG